MRFITLWFEWGSAQYLEYWISLTYKFATEHAIRFRSRRWQDFPTLQPKSSLLIHVCLFLNLWLSKFWRGKLCKSLETFGNFAKVLEGHAVTWWNRQKLAWGDNVSWNESTQWFQQDTPLPIWITHKQVQWNIWLYSWPTSEKQTEGYSLTQRSSGLV